jgi:aminoglycoside phosphotransferase (APT) family kinase protein
MTDRQAPDAARLDAWLAANLPGYAGPLRIERFQGGQSNPTFKLTTPGGAYVLRRKPAGEVLPSAHAVDREFRVLSALVGTEVPVARPRALCTDPSVIGSMFYVMDYVEGRIFWDQSLPGIPPAERAAMYDSMNATIATLHCLDYQALGLGDYGRPGNYFARQVARWTKQYRASEIETIAAMDALIEWLPAHVPARETTAIVHGDYRMDNLIFHPIEPRVVAVLDWELSTLGDAVADFAYHVMSWRISPRHFRGLAGFDLAALGIPEEAAYVATYCRRTGQNFPVPDWDVYVVFGMFRIAAILQGVLKRGLVGSAASAEAIEHGRRGRLLAEQAWELARALG